MLTGRAIAARLDSAGKLGSTPLGLLLVDVDRLKRIDDAVGHAPADRELVEVARRLREPLDESDLIGRSGGDEFVIVSPRASGEKQLAGLAEALKTAVSRVPVRLGATDLKVTVTVGGARVEPGVALMQAWRLADERLNRAKRRRPPD
jgi:diguanylate cyclase (GGDEF)-like protein